MISLEGLLTSKTGFDLPTASALQLAVARGADGRPIGDDLDDAAVRRHFGCERSQVGLVAPVLVVIVAGVRGGKSMLAACAAIKGCLTADLSALKTHEIARFAVIAPTIDNAAATFRMLVGHVEASADLRRLKWTPDDKNEKNPTADTLTLRRPDGRLVEIVVVAASRGAVTVRSRWLVGFVLDEVALFSSEAGGAVINAEELLRAAETRLVPGAQGWLISSPFGPQGLLYDLWKEHYGKPSSDVLVVHAPTRALNPSFPQATVERIRKRAPDVAAREYEAEWLDAESAFYDGAAIDRAMRAAPLVRAPINGAIYVAAWDAAMRGNAWTLVIARKIVEAGKADRYEVAVAKEWIGSKSKPLDVEATIAEIGTTLRPYNVREVMADGWSVDALNAIARRHGFAVREWRAARRADRTYEMHRGLAVKLGSAQVDLPPVPALRNDLKLARRKATSNGVKIDFPVTADGRHCDFAPAVALAVFFADRMTGGVIRTQTSTRSTWADGWLGEPSRPDAFNF